MTQWRSHVNYPHALLIAYDGVANMFFISNSNRMLILLFYLERKVGHLQLHNYKRDHYIIITAVILYSAKYYPHWNGLGFFYTKLWCICSSSDEFVLVFGWGLQTVLVPPAQQLLPGDTPSSILAAVSLLSPCTGDTVQTGTAPGKICKAKKNCLWGYEMPWH